MKLNNDQINHVHGLDLLRGLSCYSIIVCHYFAFSYGHFFSEYLSFIFVEFFFVLSGFVLFPQLIKIFDNKKNLAIFYQRRWLRTLPLYIVCLTLISIMFGEFLSLDYFKYFFFIQDFAPNFLSTNYYTIVWSLAIEEYFYLLFPLFLIYSKKENVFLYSLYLFIFVILIKILFIDSFDSKFARVGTFFRFDAILLGFIIRHIYTKINLYTSTILAIFFLTIYFQSQEFIVQNKDTLFIKYGFVLLLQSISACVLIFFCNIERFMKINIVRKISSLIANQAYSLYLIHMVFIYILKDIGMGNISKFLIYMILLFTVSTIAYYYFEKPILKIRPKLLKKI